MIQEAYEFFEQPKTTNAAFETARGAFGAFVFSLFKSAYIKCGSRQFI